MLNCYFFRAALIVLIYFFHFNSTMDVINKLYSSVSNTVSQLSSVLPGNPITKEFDVGEHIASAGPGMSFVYFIGINR